MAESIESLFRRGLISSKAMEKFGKRGNEAKPKILSETKVQASKMANFADKRGRNDQGGVRDKGAKVASAHHIDVRQDLGSPARASGRPSKGGFVPDQMQVQSDEIDDADNQQPAFPKAAKVKAANGSRQVGVKAPPGKSSGPQYGGPNSRYYG
jgi:hypothetical protein